MEGPHGDVSFSNFNDPSISAFANFVVAKADLVLRVSGGNGLDGAEEAAAWGGINWGTLSITL